MKLKSNFCSDLDFHPLNSWPEALPCVAINDQLICGFNSNIDQPVYSHPDQGIEINSSRLKSIYPQLTLPELARLFARPTFSQYFTTEAVLKNYNLNLNSELSDVMEVLMKSNADFQNFVSLKKIGAQELHPLTCLSGSDQIFVQQQILFANESKQDSVKRLELLSDLLQLKTPAEKLVHLDLKSLHDLRYPVTSLRDKNLQNQTLPWLSQIRSQFKRRGDKGGFEVQFFAGTPAELSKLAQNLSRVAEAWNSNRD